MANLQRLVAESLMNKYGLVTAATHLNERIT
jgi:hypothetical protein